MTLRQTHTGSSRFNVLMSALGRITKETEKQMANRKASPELYSVHSSGHFLDEKYRIEKSARKEKTAKR